MIPVRENSEVVIIYPDVWYIYLHNWVIYVGQMLVNIPAPWNISG